MPLTQRNAKVSELISVTSYPLKPRILAGKNTVYKTLFPGKKYLFRLPTGPTSLRIGYLTISLQNLAVEKVKDKSQNDSS